MNREWHKQHKMPDGATETERIEWHIEHASNCACRPAPKDLLARMSEHDGSGKRHAGAAISSQSHGEGVTRR